MNINPKEVRLLPPTTVLKPAPRKDEFDQQTIATLIITQMGLDRLKKVNKRNKYGGNIDIKA